MEERYGSEQAFAIQIEDAANKMKQDGFLLEEEKVRLVQRATEYGFNL
jgi:hypothetical protein